MITVGADAERRTAKGLTAIIRRGEVLRIGIGGKGARARGAVAGGANPAATGWAANRLPAAAAPDGARHRGHIRRRDRSARSGARARPADRCRSRAWPARHARAVHSDVRSLAIVVRHSVPGVERADAWLVFDSSDHRPRPTRSGEQDLSHFFRRLDPEQREPRGEHCDDPLHQSEPRRVVCGSFWIMKRK